jgi:hypothetical protein
MAQVLGITGLPTGVECAFVQRQLPEICRLSHAWAVPGAACRPAAVNSLFFPSPTDALIGLKQRAAGHLSPGTGSAHPLSESRSACAKLKRSVDATLAIAAKRTPSLLLTPL